MPEHRNWYLDPIGAANSGPEPPGRLLRSARRLGRHPAGAVHASVTPCFEALSAVVYMTGELTTAFLGQP